MQRLISLLLAGTMSAVALAAPPVGNKLSVEGSPLAPDQIGGPGPARHEAMWALHTRALHDKLKLKPEQEPAWSAFSKAMKPEAKPMGQANATAPERMEQRVQQMQQRLEALKTFYAQLTPEQRKVLDQMHADGMGPMFRQPPAAKP